MREPLPNLPMAQYDRPNQPWICGLTEVGHTCPAGPTAHGHCPALAECFPRRDGDRWQCNRSELRGGPCDEGPMPDGTCSCVGRCQPVRSLRAMRGRFATACTLAVFGALLMSLSANWRDKVISPGPLSQHHSQLLDGATSNAASGPFDSKCAMCHANADTNFAGWTAATIGLRAHDATQSQLCMKCHEASIISEFALAAHNLSPETLQQISTRRDQGTRTSAIAALLNTAPPGNGELACAICHREHQGAGFNIASMSNSACQACHQQRYKSFAADHPDFGKWPYERRTAITFDHVSHSAKHFAEKKQAFDCRTCHIEDATQTTELLANYDIACASCHDEKIATSVARGVPMLVLPTLDVVALKEAGFIVGPWPERATGDFDGRLPPTMKLLLAADPAAAKAMITLGPDFEFLDVDPDNEAQLEACAALATAIRTLLADMNERGPIAVRQRLAATLGSDLPQWQADALVAGLSEDTVHSAITTWLPDVAAKKSNWPASTISETQSTPTFGPSGAWAHDDATLSIYYRPAAHADPVLASWLALLVDTPAIDERPLELAMLKELSKPTAPGLCASCHSIERTGKGSADESLAIHWKPRSRGAARTFTKFTHGPHVILPQLSDCTACHALGTSASAAPSYANWNAHQFVSEFQPMTKQQCAACHTAKAAGDQCQQCHNYHITAPETWRMEEAGGTDATLGGTDTSRQAALPSN